MLILKDFTEWKTKDTMAFFVLILLVLFLMALGHVVLL